MDNSTKVYRMKLSTYRRIRRNFKAKRDETVAEYFERLSNYLNEKVHKVKFKIVDFLKMKGGKEHDRTSNRKTSLVYEEP